MSPIPQVLPHPVICHTQYRGHMMMVRRFTESPQTAPHLHARDAGFPAFPGPLALCCVANSAEEIKRAQEFGADLSPHISPVAHCCEGRPSVKLALRGQASAPPRSCAPCPCLVGSMGPWAELPPRGAWSTPAQVRGRCCSGQQPASRSCGGDGPAGLRLHVRQKEGGRQVGEIVKRNDFFSTGLRGRQQIPGRSEEGGRPVMGKPHNGLCSQHGSCSSQPLARGRGDGEREPANGK